LGRWDYRIRGFDIVNRPGGKNMNFFSSTYKKTGFSNVIIQYIICEPGNDEEMSSLRTMFAGEVNYHA